MKDHVSVLTQIEIINRKNMKQLILMGLLIVFSITMSNSVYGQTYTTESKSCGSCGKQVSNNSRVGMICPHCGVRWGYENESKSTKYNYTPPSNNYNDYDSYKSTGVTSSIANLRSQASKNASILTVVPAYTSVSILKKVGDWFYVEYSYYDDNLRSRKINGFIHKSLIN